MGWDSVPWFTEGGAEHSSEVARLLAYAAFSGSEGTIGSADLQVRALASPAAAVQILPGACAILNRAAGATYQAYAGRLPVAEQIPIAGTGAAARSDLIVARIENPNSYGETWPNPSNPATGPYVFTRVISGVPATTKSVRQIRPTDSAITLARIDIPANTSTVTGSMVKDLREMANPRRRRVVRAVRGVFPADEVGNVRNPEWEEFPNGCRWPIEIPEWATSATVMVTWAGLNQRNAKDSYGYLRGNLGGLLTPNSVYDVNWVGNPIRVHCMAGGSVSIPAAMRGTVQDLVMEGSGYAGTNIQGVLEANTGSSMFADVEFVESAQEDSF
ncbi:hypothetical protein G3I60_05370 [Streptomyces sp. SID13666]|uniref:hypothetical protein n=1 Tax=Streptomyces sp. SID13666 TaxID=2706054 RepID=UPI0013C09316|nr:hypothetical protein [Streptomyces sp. SID13666]NEA53601.1 hypothetical protein [Streptomyces sp. SID13666]